MEKNIKTFDDKTAWLAFRREIITASDVASILSEKHDIEAYRTALDVYTDKMRGLTMQDNDALMLGRCLEDGIARAYAEKTGYPVEDTGNYTIFMHPKIPWLGATLDRIVEVDGKKMPLEIKNVGLWNAHKWAGEDIPLFVQVQLQIQIACFGSDRGAFAAAVNGTKFRHGIIEENKDFISSIVPELEAFRRRLVDRTPPPVQTPKHLKTIKALHPDDTGETIEFDDKYSSIVDEWEIAKENLKEIGEKKDLLEAQIREALAEKTFAKLPDGSFLTLKTTTRKGYIREVKESKYRTLRHISKT